MIIFYGVYLSYVAANGLNQQHFQVVRDIERNFNHLQDCMNNDKFPAFPVVSELEKAIILTLCYHKDLYGICSSRTFQAISQKRYNFYVDTWTFLKSL